jgi:hypothetical protein
MAGGNWDEYVTVLAEWARKNASDVSLIFYVQ